MATTASSVKITDISLLALHQQRESTFNSAKSEKERVLPEYEKKFGEIADFSKEVRSRGKAFQEGTVNPIPKQPELEAEKQKFLRQYWDYSETLEKVGQLGDNLNRAIVFLTPKSRTYKEENALKQHTSLYEQTQVTEKFCLDNLGKLQGMLTETKALQERMLTAVQDRDLNWSIQRFCGIVDNKGRPLSGLNKGWNFMANSLPASFIANPPPIPKPTALSENQGTAQPSTEVSPQQANTQNTQASPGSSQLTEQQEKPQTTETSTESSSLPQDSQSKSKESTTREKESTPSQQQPAGSNPGFISIARDVENDKEKQKLISPPKVADTEDEETTWWCCRLFKRQTQS